MSIVTIDDTNLTNIADAIRDKKGTSDTYKPSEMASAIQGISTSEDLSNELNTQETLLDNQTSKLIVAINNLKNKASGGADTTMEDALLTNGIEGAYTNDRITNVGKYALASHPVTSVSFPNATTIGLSAFGDCTSLTEVNIPNATTINQSAFTNCNKLTSIDLPKVTSIGNSAFYQDRKLTNVSAPLLETLGNNGFRFCPLQEEVRFPYLEKMGTYAFYSCTNVKILDLNVIPKIDTNALYGCTSLETLILRKTDAICTLANTTNALTNTPIANGTGYVYVPDDLVDTYKSATNWSTYASQIKPLSELGV